MKSFNQAKLAKTQASGAATQAAEAAAQASEISKKLDEIKRYEELGNDIKLRMEAINKKGNYEKGTEYLSILKELQKNSYFGLHGEYELSSAISHLESYFPQKNPINDYSEEQSSKALARAEGLINSCINKLRRRG